MPKQPLNILLRSKIFVAILMGVLLFLGIIQLFQGLIDTQSYRRQIVGAVQDITGRDMLVRGDVHVSLLPLPTLNLPGVEFVQTDGSAPSVSVEMVNIRLSPWSIFSGELRVSHVELDKPSVGVTRSKNDAVNWDWIGASLLPPPGAAGNGATDVGLTIRDGKLVYRVESENRSYVIGNIHADGRVGGRVALEGTMAYGASAVGFSLSMAEGKGAVPRSLDVKLFSGDKDVAQWHGTLDISAAAAKLEGEFAFTSANMMVWAKAQGGAQPNAIGNITNESVQKTRETILLPLKAQAHWRQDGWNIALSDVRIDGMDSSGDGTAQVGWQGNVPAFSLDLDFSALDYEKWKLLMTDVLGWNLSAQPPPAAYDDEAGQNYEPIPKTFNLKVKVAADALHVGDQLWNAALLDMALDEGTVTVNRLGVELPGKSSLTLFGVISQGGNKGLRFEGNMETQGKSLRNILTVFDASAANLPETGLGDFYARANIYASPEQMRLSEADAKISELHLSGGLVAYFDSNPRIEADVRLRDINFDYFRDMWRKKQSQASPRDFFLRYDKSMNFDWLKKLQTRIDFKVGVDNFTFMERQGQMASFRLFANDGELGIYNVRFDYPDDTTEGSFSLNVRNEQPQISLVLNTVELNTDYFSALPQANETNGPGVGMALPAPGEAAPAETLPVVAVPGSAPAAVDAEQPDLGPGEVEQSVTIVPQAQPETVVAEAPGAEPVSPLQRSWSQDLIDMSWMEGITGSFDISIGRLVHGDVVLDRLKTRAKLENNVVTFQSLSFLYWQGNCEVTGSVFGGRVPGVSVGFTLYNAELGDILKSLVARDNISGKVSISGTLTTSGVNYASWVSQSDAKIVFSGRGVNVGGFNLQGVMDAVAVSRTSADVFNNVNRAAFAGTTEMSVDGNINVRAGVLRTPGITLKSGAIVGNFSGEARLSDWTMDMSALYQFPALATETTPTMSIRLVGPLGSPELQTDTSSLEAYVAKRIIGR